MGLKTLVRDDLKLRGLTWDRKATQAAPNKRAAQRLQRRQSGFVQEGSGRDLPNHQRTMPGSYNRKRG